MKKTTKVTIELKKQVIRSCLGEINSFFEGEAIAGSPCKSTLASLSVSTQQAICLDPLSELLNEKNIFSLGEDFFKKKAINELGCDLATQLVVNFLYFIQRKSCQLIDSKEIFSVVPINQGLESVKKNSCSSALNSEFINKLKDCLPNSRNMNLEQAQNFTLCIQKITNLPVGEKIKLCDNILRALSSEVSTLQVNPNNYFPLSIANSNETSPQNNLYKILSLQRNYSLNTESILLEKLLLYRRIEKIACTSLQRNNNAFTEGKPLNELLSKACFTRNKQAKNEPLQIDLCETYTKKINEEDRSLFCNRTSEFFNFFKSSRFYEEGFQRLQLLCNNLTGYFFNTSEVHQKIYQENQSSIFEEIRSTNQRNGITPGNLQQANEQNQSRDTNHSFYNNSSLFAINQTSPNTTLSNLTDSFFYSSNNFSIS